MLLFLAIVDICVRGGRTLNSISFFFFNYKKYHRVSSWFIIIAVIVPEWRKGSAVCKYTNFWIIWDTNGLITLLSQSWLQTGRQAQIRGRGNQHLKKMLPCPEAHYSTRPTLSPSTTLLAFLIPKENKKHYEMGVEEFGWLCQIGHNCSALL